MNLYIERPFHQPTFEIISSDKTLIESLQLQYNPFTYENPTSDTDNCKIEVTKQIDNYIIKYNGTEISTQVPLFEIDKIFFENTFYDDSILALHGSAVEYSGKAYVFLAATSSGKTTLASYLTSSGFGYITDDCILIERETLRVYPYTCSIQLRDGGLEVLKKLKKIPQNLRFFDAVFTQRYVYLPQNSVTDCLPLGGIYFIKRSETHNIVINISSNEKMAELIKSPITHYEITPDYLKLLARLSQTECQVLIYKDMDFVAETIKRVGESFG